MKLTVSLWQAFFFLLEIMAAKVQPAWAQSDPGVITIECTETDLVSGATESPVTFTINTAQGAVDRTQSNQVLSIIDGQDIAGTYYLAHVSITLAQIQISTEDTNTANETMAQAVDANTFTISINRSTGAIKEVFNGSQGSVSVGTCVKVKTKSVF